MFLWRNLENYPWIIIKYSSSRNVLEQDDYNIDHWYRFHKSRAWWPSFVGGHLKLCDIAPDKVFFQAYKVLILFLFLHENIDYGTH